MKKDYELKVDEAVKKLHWIGENNVIEIYADYRDDSEFLLDTIYDNRNGEDLEALVQEQIHESYIDQIAECGDDVLRTAEVYEGEHYEEAREYLESTYFFEPPYDHFLDQDIKVNIMLATDEDRNRDYVGIHEQYMAMEKPDSVWSAADTLAERTALIWLLEQQGHTLPELQATLKDYDAFFYGDEPPAETIGADGKEKSLSECLEIFNQNHNAFLTSVCQELENQNYYMGVMTVLAEMSIKDFIKMQSGEKQVTLPKDAMIGIFNPWNGSGSCLEIELEKPLAFSTDMVRDVQIEGVKPQFEYTVDSVYGLIGTCWKEPLSIEEPKKGLDDMIKAASLEASNGVSVPEKDVERDDR